MSPRRIATEARQGRAQQRWEDALGLYFYQARWYDPALGRFIQPDTIVPEPGNPQALNRYSYCLNNPVRYSDPSGHAREAGTGQGLDWTYLYGLRNYYERAIAWFIESGGKTTLPDASGMCDQSTIHLAIWAVDLKLSGREPTLAEVALLESEGLGEFTQSLRDSTMGATVALATFTGAIITAGHGPYRVEGNLANAWGTKRNFQGWLRGVAKKSTTDPLSYEQAAQIIANARQLGIDDFDFNPDGLQGKERRIQKPHFKIGRDHFYLEGSDFNPTKEYQW